MEFKVCSDTQVDALKERLLKLKKLQLNMVEMRERGYLKKKGEPARKRKKSSKEMKGGTTQAKTEIELAELHINHLLETIHNNTINQGQYVKLTSHVQALENNFATLLTIAEARLNAKIAKDKGRPRILMLVAGVVLAVIVLVGYLIGNGFHYDDKKGGLAFRTAPVQRDFFAMKRQHMKEFHDRLNEKMDRERVLGRRTGDAAKHDEELLAIIAENDIEIDFEATMKEEQGETGVEAGTEAGADAEAEAEAGAEAGAEEDLCEAETSAEVHGHTEGSSDDRRAHRRERRAERKGNSRQVPMTNKVQGEDDVGAGAGADAGAGAGAGAGADTDADAATDADADTDASVEDKDEL